MQKEDLPQLVQDQYMHSFARTCTITHNNFKKKKGSNKEMYKGGKTYMAFYNFGLLLGKR